MAVSDYFALWLKGYAWNIVRYLLVAGPLYFVIWKLNRFRKNRIPNRIETTHKKLEAVLTLTNLMIFATVGALIALVKAQTGYSAIYTDIAEYGWIWFFCSIFIFAALTDTYYYWVHRAMHGKFLFRPMHALHHRFMNPTPWAAYSLNYVEGVLLASSLFIFLMILPMHPIAVLIYTTYGIAWTTFIHLGYEILPESWSKHKVFKWLNTPTHHSHHHQHFNYNYSLYFTFWDKWMKTEYPKTQIVFEEIER